MSFTIKLPPVRLCMVNKRYIALRAAVPGSNVRVYRNLGIEIKATNWDPKNEHVKKAELNHARINSGIWSDKAEVIKRFEDMHRASVPFTKENIYSGLHGLTIATNTDFYHFSRNQIAIKTYSSETRRTYTSEVSKMEQFAAVLNFSEINFSWLQKYEQYMRDKLLNHPNTIWKSFKFISTMINAALKTKGVITENPFDIFARGSYKQGIPSYLEWPELQAYHNAVKAKPMTDYMRLIGYYSLLSAYSGLRYGDAVKFDYSKKVIETATGKRLLLYAAKNGEIVSIAFTSFITEVVEYIRDKPITITNQEFNRGVASLRSIAEITKEISSHSFRHTFACRCAELGMSIDDVQKLLGHNKRSSTEIYFKIRPARLDGAMALWEK